MILEKLKQLKHKKAILITAVLLLSAAIIGTVYYTNVVSTARRYEQAQTAFEERDYEKAEALFAALGDYKDSAKMAKKSKNTGLKNNYNHALSLYDSGEYQQALAILEGMSDEYEMSATLAEQCRGMIEQQESFENTDPQFAAYYSVVKRYYNSYGKPKVVRDTSVDAKAYRLSGVSLVQVCDFDNNGIEELIIAHGSDFEVYAYIGGKAKKVYSGDMQERTEVDFYTVETFRNESGAESLCFGSRNSGKCLRFNGEEFVPDFRWSHSKNSYTIDGKTVKKQDYEKRVPPFKYDAFFVSKKTPLERYTNSFMGHTVYAASFLSRHAADDMKNSADASYNSFLLSYQRVNK